MVCLILTFFTFQLCSLFKKKNWTLERDEDLTAPYAYSGDTWLAFEDEISVNIKVRLESKI